MQVLHSDNQLILWGGRVHLPNFAGHSWVVGRGSLCAVANDESGTLAMARMKVIGKPRGVAIAHQHGDDEEGASLLNGAACA